MRPTPPTYKGLAGKTGITSTCSQRADCSKAFHVRILSYNRGVAQEGRVERKPETLILDGSPRKLGQALC